MLRPEESRILVVDDEQDTCSNMADILSDLGYRVDCACDGPTALELVRRAHYDVALMDLRMPGMDGLTLYREIRKLRAETMAILITAYAGKATSREALTDGIWKVLPKPVDLPKVLNLLDVAKGQPLVLIVDDDHELCETQWQILRDRGYRVAVAHDTASAAEQLRCTSFRVALIDMKLPDGDGGEVFRLLQERTPKARTILITGSRPTMGALADRAKAVGADATCYKPFDVPRLLDTLDRLAKAPR